MTASNLLTTPLYALHLRLQAKMVPFAGYQMPVQYPAGLFSEHLHCRNAAALFDVSHMGQISITGPSAAAALESILPIDVQGLNDRQQRYGLLLNDQGGILDDLMLLRLGDTYWMVVNGACKHSDLEYLQKTIGQHCTVTPFFDRALIALQGPKAALALQTLVPDVRQLHFMQGAHFDWQGIRLTISRSGYSGEDGFEIGLAAEHANDFAEHLLQHPEVKAVGLGARNSLRLEAGLCLYGADLDANTTPVEANLEWAIQKVRRSQGTRAGGFPGAQHILSQLDNPSLLSKKRCGLVANERIPVREPAPLHASPGGEVIGQVSSGILSPIRNEPIALAYLPPRYTSVGTVVHAQVRNQFVPMTVATTPFVPSRYYRG